MGDRATIVWLIRTTMVWVIGQQWYGLLSIIAQWKKQHLLTFNDFIPYKIILHMGIWFLCSIPYSSVSNNVLYGQYHRNLSQIMVAMFHYILIYHRQLSLCSIPSSSVKNNGPYVPYHPHLSKDNGPHVPYHPHLSKDNGPHVTYHPHLSKIIVLMFHTILISYKQWSLCSMSSSSATNKGIYVPYHPHLTQTMVLMSHTTQFTYK